MAKLNICLLYGLTFLSGIAALISETVWQKYFTILLGAQARATALVLAIFLLGLSIGYFLFGKISEKRPNPFRTCAWVEVGIMGWTLLFPLLFSGALGTLGFFKRIGLPDLLIDLLTSTALMLPPSILFGATLPLLTEGLDRFNARLGVSVNRGHAWLYGLNTLGAAAGGFFAGYLLIPLTSFRSALVIAAGLNGIAAIGLFRFFRSEERALPRPQSPKRQVAAREILLIGLATVSGFAIITLESVLIRLVGISTGSSQYNFTLIVTVFIGALGLGSVLCGRLGEVKDGKTIALLGRLRLVQFLIFFSLLLLYVSVDFWPYWVHLIRIRLSRIPEAFFLYQLLLFGFFSLLLFPVVLCGLSLPLTFNLVRENAKESGIQPGREVGLIYGFNTLGTVAGAFLGGYYFLHFWNLDLAFKLCVWVFLLGWTAILCFQFLAKQISIVRLGILGGIAIIFSLTTFALPPFNYSGFLQPFRQQEPNEASFKGLHAFQKQLTKSLKLLRWEDGPNTSVAISSYPPEGIEINRTIFVNGKSDGNTRGDALTTLLLAHIPALLTPEISRVNVIGFGTGMTAGALALYSEVKHVDVSEISGTIIKRANEFDEYNGSASKNPKISLNETDGFRFLSHADQQYDLIVSEPSNPWVSGVENLYSKEFYELARSRLTPHGTMAQWIHAYSFNDTLFRRVLGTLLDAFPNVRVFQLQPHDYLLIASRADISPSQYPILKRRMNEQMVGMNLNVVAMKDPLLLLGLEIMNSSVVYDITRGVERHRLESPRLSYEAARSFFSGEFASPHQLKRDSKRYGTFVDSALLTQYLNREVPTAEMLAGFHEAFCKHPVTGNRTLCEEVTFATTFQKLTTGRDPLKGKGGDVKVPDRVTASVRNLNQVDSKTFRPDDLIQIYNGYEEYKKFRSPLNRVPSSVFVKRLDNCLRVVKSSEDLYGECLLQKILVLQQDMAEQSKFPMLAKNFIEWFDKYPKERDKFSRFEKAKQLLNELLDMDYPRK